MLKIAKKASNERILTYETIIFRFNKRTIVATPAISETTDRTNSWDLVNRHETSADVGRTASFPYKEERLVLKDGEWKYQVATKPSLGSRAKLASRKDDRNGCPVPQTHGIRGPGGVCCRTGYPLILPPP